jgi:hypothetical protein
MNTRLGRTILLIFLLLTTSCQTKPEKKAEKLAREQMALVMGADAVDRSVVEVHLSKVGWMIIFRDANASCQEGFSLIGACRFGNRVFKDVYACVERNWNIEQMGYSGESESLGEEDLCQQVPAPELPTAEANPTLTVSKLPTATELSNSPTLSADALSEIIYVSDPSLPQYDPNSLAFVEFPNVVKQISDMGANAIDVADDLAVAIRFPRQDSYLAAQALLKLGSDITATTISLLIDNLRDEKSETRIYSVILLGSVGTRASCAVGNIAPFLWDSDPYVRSATALALEKITEQDIIESAYEISITPAFLANSVSADTPEGKVVEKARKWWDEQG